VSRVTLLIDGDPLVYACGFVAEKRRHLLSWVDVTKDGDVIRRATFESAWRRDRFIELVNLHPDEYEAELYSIPYPFSFAAQAFRTTLEGIEKNVGEYLRAVGHEPGGTRIYLTGTGNFRAELATIKPYKGNRTAPRPYHYDALRQYMVEKHGAKVVNGIEADDAVSIIQWRGRQKTPKHPRTIICTVDKDLLMVPGFHYNTREKEAWYQSPEEAQLAFYRQLLTGDGTDNIPGCHGIGKARASVILPSLLWSERQMYDVVLAEYAANMVRYPEHHRPHTLPEDALLENARLLWMLRHKGDVWEPPV